MKVDVLSVGGNRMVKVEPGNVSGAHTKNVKANISNMSKERAGYNRYLNQIG